MSAVRHFGSTGELIDDLARAYEAGRLKGLIALTVLNDGEFATAFSGDLGYLEKLGLLESAKQDAFAAALGLVQPGRQL